jgi:hypothetical protein
MLRKISCMLDLLSCQNATAFKLWMKAENKVAEQQPPQQTCPDATHFSAWTGLLRIFIEE